jgi:hypothetical protein
MKPFPRAREDWKRISPGRFGLPEGRRKHLLLTSAPPRSSVPGNGRNGDS